MSSHISNCQPLWREAVAVATDIYYSTPSRLVHPPETTCDLSADDEGWRNQGGLGAAALPITTTSTALVDPQRA